MTRVFRSFQFSAPYRTLRLLSACSNQLSYQGRQMHTLRNMRDSIDYSCVINHQVCHYSKNGVIFLEQQMTDEQTLVRTGTCWSILLIIRVKPSNQHIVMSSTASTRLASSKMTKEKIKWDHDKEVILLMEVLSENRCTSIFC